MYKLFIGIDFSKKKIDVSAFVADEPSTSIYESFSNDASGHLEMLSWLDECYGSVPKSAWLFCGEHTGLYSVVLSDYLASKGYFIWLENACQIKQSTGIRRGKTDRLDSLMIAWYAYRFKDKALRYTPASKYLKQLHMLFTFRDLQVKIKTELLVHAKELRSTLQADAAVSYIYKRCQMQLAGLVKEIKKIEAKILEILRKEEELKNNYDRITSIKGISFVNAIALIIYTANFTKFTDARKLACYAGVVPFERTSGSSVRKKARVSGFANKKLKTLLTQAARCAVVYDPFLRMYYQRKIEEGKHKSLILNNVRNKLIHRIFALVRDQTFDDQYHFLNCC